MCNYAYNKIWFECQNIKSYMKQVFHIPGLPMSDHPIPPQK